VMDAALKYPLRYLPGNKSDAVMERDCFHMFFANFRDDDFSTIQQHYKSGYRVCNYLFDFHDEYEHTPAEIQQMLRVHNEFLWNTMTNNRIPLNKCWGLGIFTHLKSNFSPMTAKKLYQTYCRPGGTIYDYSMGYGGRMMGAGLNEENYVYLGVDPNTENIPGYEKLKSYLQFINPKFRVDYRSTGSEIYHPEWTNQVDFAFSSPPYFDTEIYTNEETQAYIMYPKYEDFLEYYWRPTVKNAYIYLKETGVFSLNIKNRKDHPYWDDFVRIVNEQGLFTIDVIDVQSSTGGGGVKGDLGEHFGFFMKKPDYKLRKSYSRPLF